MPFLIPLLVGLAGAVGTGVSGYMQSEATRKAAEGQNSANLAANQAQIKAEKEMQQEQLKLDREQMARNEALQRKANNLSIMGYNTGAGAQNAPQLRGTQTKIMAPTIQPESTALAQGIAGGLTSLGSGLNSIYENQQLSDAIKKLSVVNPNLFSESPDETTSYDDDLSSTWG